MNLLAELKRRNVLRMAALYVVTAWLVMQVVGVVMDLAPVPPWVGPATLWLLAIGFPIALLVSWFYEITPDGISLDEDVDRSITATNVSGRRFDLIVIAILSAAIILFAFEKWWPDAPPERSIAVLAFQNMSSDPDQEYFSDGIAEEVLNMLARVPELTVKSRSSAFSFKGKDVTIPELAEQLNVAHVLEGSVRRQGNRVRITAQLINASSDVHLWSNTYDRDIGDIFAIQEEIAIAISDELKLELTAGTSMVGRPAAATGNTIDAYDVYLQARSLIHSRGLEKINKAIDLLQRSIRLESSFAPAHAQLAIAYTLLFANESQYPHAEAVRRADPHIRRALELEPNLAEAHAARALLELSVDRASALENAQKALTINPNYADALHWSQLALRSLGRYEEAAAALENLLRVDPLSVVGRLTKMYSISSAGDLERAHEMADEIFAEDPQRAYSAHADLLLNYQGQLAEALRLALRSGLPYEVMFVVFSRIGEYEEIRRGGPGGGRWLAAAEGRFEEAIEETQRDLQRRPDDRRAIWEAAEFLYDAGRLEEAHPLYERLRDFVPEGRPIPSSIADRRSANETMMRLAHARRIARDEEGAGAAAEIVKRNLAAQRANGADNQFVYRAEAMIGAFDRDTDRVFAAAASALRLGLRDRQFFDDAIFDDVRNDPRFIALRQELDSILAGERIKVLQLICFENPVPDEWQPLPETCEGVADLRKT